MTCSTSIKSSDGSKIIWQAVSAEIPVLEPWLKQFIQSEVIFRQVEAIAWLLGFWIGDGHRRGVAFALQSGDQDVNSKLAENGQLWGLNFRKKDVKGFEATGYLHTYNRKVHKCNFNVDNLLVEVLKGLRFGVNGRINGPKNVPLFS